MQAVLLALITRSPQAQAEIVFRAVENGMIQRRFQRMPFYLQRRFIRSNLMQNRNESFDGSFRASLEGASASEGILIADSLLFAGAPTESWRYRYIKRAIDVVISLVAIPALALPGLMIAAAIVLTSEGPVFYREERIGRNGRVFRIWKYRTMSPDAGRRISAADPELGEPELEFRTQKHLPNPRITPAGAFLRTWSLDEFPQLLNVLQGDMSLIGPRPVVEKELHLYGNLRHCYLSATPGLSGLWQVSGRSHVNYEKRAQLDAMYVNNWSLRSDFDILLRTIPAVLQRTGAC
jgi:exopolysaccharide production protein ExoY